LVSVLPRYFFAAALATQLVALAVPLLASADIAHAMLGAAVLVGLVALTVLLVDYTTAPAGSVTQRLRGMASAWTSVLVVGFTLAWYVFPDATPGSVFAIEMVSFAGGALGYWQALRHGPAALNDDPDEMSEGWPFPAVR
jgi:hypothetical protein